MQLNMPSKFHKYIQSFKCLENQNNSKKETANDIDILSRFQ